MKPTAPRATPSNRPLKVGEAVRHALVAALRENTIHDVELARRNVTVSEVRMSPDLRHANVFVAPLGGVDAEGMMADLKRCAPRLRTAVAHAVQLRYAPELHFFGDTSFEYAQSIDQLLNRPEVARDLEKK